MRSLIVEDDLTSRVLLEEILTRHGPCSVAVDGKEAVYQFVRGWKEGRPFDLILMDIMMPKLDGKKALERIREMERDMGVPHAKEVKVIMVSALGDPKNVMEAYRKGGATSYVVKPIDKAALLEEIRGLGLLP